MSNIVDLRNYLMAGDLDPVSRIVGGFEKFEAFMNKRMDAQDSQLNQISTKVSDLANTVSIDHTYMENHVRPAIERLIRDKAWGAGWKAAWAARIGTGAVGGAAVVYVPKFAAFLSHLFP